MRVVVDFDGARLQIDEEFTAFDFVTALDPVDLGRTITELDLGVADPNAEQVWFDVAGLIRIAGPLAEPEWRRRLDGMVGYPSAHGWVDGARRVRAHRAPLDGTP